MKDVVVRLTVQQAGAAVGALQLVARFPNTTPEVRAWLRGAEQAIQRAAVGAKSTPHKRGNHALH